MKHGKHRYDKSIKKRKRKLLVFFLVFVIVLISVAFIISSTYGNVEKPEANEIVENTIPEEPEEVELPPEQFEIVDISDLPDKYQGYTVVGKLVIDKLGVTQKILDTTADEALKLGVTKFWGPDINEPRKSMFIRT